MFGLAALFEILLLFSKSCIRRLQYYCGELLGGVQGRTGADKAEAPQPLMISMHVAHADARQVTLASFPSRVFFESCERQVSLIHCHFSSRLLRINICVLILLYTREL